MSWPLQDGGIPLGYKENVSVSRISRDILLFSFFPAFVFRGTVLGCGADMSVSPSPSRTRHAKQISKNNRRVGGGNSRRVSFDSPPVAAPRRFIMTTTVNVHGPCDDHWQCAAFVANPFSDWNVWSRRCFRNSSHSAGPGPGGQKCFNYIYNIIHCRAF